MYTWQLSATKRRSIEGLLLVSLNGAVGGGVGHAGEDKAVAHLVVIEERLVGLVNGTGSDLSGARRASASTAGVGQVDA
jgi:hypothetical protein